MKLRQVVLVLIVLALALGVNNTFNVFSITPDSQQGEADKEVDTIDNREDVNKIKINDSLYQPKTNWGIYKEKVEVKGIFLTAGSLSLDSRFNYLLDLVNETEINSMVIDVKNDNGTLTYKSESDIAKDINPKYVIKTESFINKMNILLDNNVYPIARIVTFKDKQAGAMRPDLVLKAKNGQVWRDNKGNTWLNPFNKEAWEYPIQLAEEAALKGFKEIQFDYVRFPTDGDVGNIDFGDTKGKTKADAIAEFLAYARERLEPLGAYVSADVFGHIINVKGDAGIGQNMEKLAVSTDILCPMVYPSHYALGSYGVPYPDSDPYKIIIEAMSRAVRRVDNAEGDDDKKAILRPWLQDFSATWLKDKYGEYYVSYGPEQVRAQIQATYDAGLKEWILWNSGNRYTTGALLKAEDDNINN